MSEELKKWFADFLNSIAEKIKRGEKLSSLEIEIASDYVSNLQLFEYVDKRISDLEKKIEATRSDLEKKIEGMREDLLKRIEGVDAKVDAVRSDLEKKVERVRSDLDKKIEATRSDLGLLTEEVYVRNFVDYLEKSGERVISVYRHYESNAGEIDALVETQARVYVVEVKMRAELKDVDDLISKAKAVSEEYKGKDVVPVLTGAKISKAVRGYAKGLNVIVA